MFFLKVKNKYKTFSFIPKNIGLSKEIKSTNILFYSTQKKNKKNIKNTNNNENKTPYDPNNTIFMKTPEGFEMLTQMNDSMTDEVDKYMAERIKPMKEKVDKEIKLKEIRKEIEEIEKPKKSEKSNKKEEKEKKPKEKKETKRKGKKEGDVELKVESMEEKEIKKEENKNSEKKIKKRKEYSDVDNDFELFLYHAYKTNTTVGVMEKILSGTYLTYVKTNVEDNEDEVIKSEITNKKELGIDSSINRIMCEEYDEEGNFLSFFLKLNSFFFF